jgi:tetraacyldisaccharide 4'-kinase
VIVSRGYGGQTEYPALVTAQSTPQQVGDEPLLMFLQSGVPVVVAPKRAEAVAYVVQHKLVMWCFVMMVYSIMLWRVI